MVITGGVDTVLQRSAVSEYYPDDERRARLPASLTSPVRIRGTVVAT